MWEKWERFSWATSCRHEKTTGRESVRPSRAMLGSSRHAGRGVGGRTRRDGMRVKCAPNKVIYVVWATHTHGFTHMHTLTHSQTLHRDRNIDTHSHTASADRQFDWCFEMIHSPTSLWVLTRIRLSVYRHRHTNTDRREALKNTRTHIKKQWFHVMRVFPTASSSKQKYLLANEKRHEKKISPVSKQK